MKVAQSTLLIFALLLVAVLANAQVPPPPTLNQSPMGQRPMGQPSLGMQPMMGGQPVVIPAPGSGMMGGGYYNGYFGPSQSTMWQSPIEGYQPSYWNQSYSQNYNFDPNSMYNPYSYVTPFNYSSAFDNWNSSSRSRDRSEEDEEKAEEREERREERRERKEAEREERRRQEREDRDAKRRDDRGEEKKEVKNWPPIPKSSEEGKKLEAQSNNQQTSSNNGATGTNGAAEGKAKNPPPKKPGAATATAAAAAKPVVATEPTKKEPAKAWWETNPEYQKYLKDKKAFEDSQKANPEWPPKPQPVTTVAPEKAIDSTDGKLAASANTDCATCGPKEGPLSQQIQTLTHLADPREVFVLTRPPSNKVSEGIRTVMNTIYQSCEAYSKLLRPDYCQDGFIGKNFCAKKYDRKAGDLTAFQDPAEFFSHEIASKAGSNVMVPDQPEAPQCRDMKKTPPVFKYAGRPVIEKDVKTGKVSLNMFNNTTAKKFVTMDCSGFVSASYTAAGLNMVPNSPKTQATTNLLRGGLATCMNRVTFAPGQQIQSGDVAVFAGESQHSMIFDRVGDDPFGLQSIPAQVPAGKTLADHCLANMNPEKFDFVIAQSGLYGGRTAVSQARAVDYVVNFGNGMMDGVNFQILQIGIDACVAKLGGKAASVNHKDGPMLFRHKGSAAAGCVRSNPTEIVGSQCLKGRCS